MQLLAISHSLAHSVSNILEKSSTHETEWQNQLLALKKFKGKYGHLSPNSNSKEYGSLGIWCISQRSQKRKGILSQKRFDLLHSIGFIWHLKN